LAREIDYSKPGSSFSVTMPDPGRDGSRSAAVHTSSSRQIGARRIQGMEGFVADPKAQVIRFEDYNPAGRDPNLEPARLLPAARQTRGAPQMVGPTLGRTRGDGFDLFERHRCAEEKPNSTPRWNGKSDSEGRISVRVPKPTSCVPARSAAMFHDRVVQSPTPQQRTLRYWIGRRTLPRIPVRHCHPRRPADTASLQGLAAPQPRGHGVAHTGPRHRLQRANGLRNGPALRSRRLPWPASITIRAANSSEPRAIPSVAVRRPADGKRHAA